MILMFRPWAEDDIMLGTTLVVLWLLLPVALLVALWLIWRRLQRTLLELGHTQQKFDQSRERFSGIVDADAEEAKVRAETAHVAEELNELKTSYSEKKAIYDG